MRILRGRDSRGFPHLLILFLRARSPGPLRKGKRGPLVSERRYRRILLTAVLSVSVVAIAPLIIATGISYFQYQEAFREEQSRPMVRFAANGKLALEAFLRGTDRCPPVRVPKLEPRGAYRSLDPG